MAVTCKSSFPRKRESSCGWIPAFAGMTLILLLCACGVQRDLIRPSDIKAKEAEKTQQQSDVR